MTIRLVTDSKQHMIGGLVVSISLVVLLFLAQYSSMAVAVAVAGPLFGWGLEKYQQIRKEGAYEVRDMISTALPFEVVAGILFLLGM